MRKKAVAEEITRDINMDDFTHRWNDAVVSLDEYKKLVSDHQEWVDAAEKKAAMVAEAEKSKRSKKNT
jgi:hypothetical protein